MSARHAGLASAQPTIPVPEQLATVQFLRDLEPLLPEAPEPASIQA